jgi:hypothetical protein
MSPLEVHSHATRIPYIKARIDALKLQLTRKPSVIKQIRDLEHQLRFRELIVAFYSK